MSEEQHLDKEDVERLGPAIAAVLARARYLDAECVLLIRRHREAAGALEAAKARGEELHEHNEGLFTDPGTIEHGWGIHAQQREEASTCLALALRAAAIEPTRRNADAYADWADELIAAGPWHRAFLKPGEHYMAF